MSRLLRCRIELRPSPLSLPLAFKFSCPTGPLVDVPGCVQCLQRRLSTVSSVLAAVTERCAAECKRGRKLVSRNAAADLLTLTGAAESEAATAAVQTTSLLHVQELALTGRPHMARETDKSPRCCPLCVIE